MNRYVAILFLLCTALSAFGTGSSGQWVEVESPHFVVLSDAGSKQALHAATQFEQMRSFFHTMLPSASDAHSPIVVVAVRDKKGMEALEPEANLSKGQVNLAGFFMRGPDKNYIVVRLDTEGEHPYSVVYHEYTHFMTRRATWLPLWLTEGLAMFYENTDIHEKSVELGQPSMNYIHYLQRTQLIPFTTLLKVDYKSPYYHQEQKASVFYGESWLLTYYLTFNDFAHKTGLLGQYAVLVSQGKDPVEAGQQAFGDLTKLQESLEGFLVHGDLKVLERNSGVAVDVSKFQQRPASQAEADAIRADVMLRNGRKKDAENLLDATLKADSNNATAHEVMGFLKYMERDYVSAQKWYGEALRLDSKNYFAHYNYATLLFRVGGSDNDAAIESSLQAAIKLNPDFAPAYDELAMFYASRDEKLDEAHLLNAHAVELEPDKLSYRLNTASVLSRQKQYVSAIGVLKTAKSTAKTPDENALIDNRIKELEQFKAAQEQIRTEDLRTGPQAATPAK